jgi:sugar/nucleoside kinase (ribokinase family)
MKLVIVGSVAHDTYSTPHGSVRKVLGGSATHASIAASYFVRPLGLVGVVGEDFHDDHVRTLEGRSINVDGLSRVKGKTFHWTGRYRGDMAVAETLKTELGVFATFNPSLPAHYRRTPFLFLANIDPEIQSRVMDQVERPRFTLLDTMNFWIQGKRAALRKALRRVDAVVLNDQEIRQLTGKGPLIEAARAALSMGPRWVVLKKGEHGATLFGGKSLIHVPAYPVEKVKDPTGAGDSFAGGFMGSLASLGQVSAENLRKSMAMGTCLASFNVEDFSIRRTKNLQKAGIKRRLEELREMARIG